MTDNSEFDLPTLMKASQTITDEIVLEKLIDKILYIMVENAGAQQGLFVLKQNDKWRIAVEMDSNKKLIKRDTTLSIEDQAEEIPVSVINYIDRCGERVVLGDAANEGQFVHDPYIAAYKSLSILCMPLKYKSHISCILYLEHNLIRDAFTSERLKKINFLLPLAAISIENARLYNILEVREKKYRKIFEDSKTRQSKDGSTLEYHGIIRDVTAEKQLEPDQLLAFELQKLKDATEHANSTNSAIISNMSHELRSPLNSIIGFTQLLSRSSNLTDEQKNDLATISRSGNHLLALINYILDLTKIETEKQTINLSFCDIYRMLKELELFIKVHTDSKNLRFRMERNQVIPRYIKTDEAKLRQILINVLVNVVKLTNEGGVLLHVNTEILNNDISNNDLTTIMLFFEVKGTNIGITEDEVEKVYNKSDQTQSSLSSSVDANLGIALAKEYVQLLGGNFEIQNPVDQETIIRFNIQVTECESTWLEEDKSIHHILSLQPNKMYKYRILLADDIEANYQLLSKLLESVGFLTKTAQNGRDAIEVFHSWQPHLVLMDLNIPEINGFEVVREIRVTPEGEKAIIILIISSGVLVETRQKVIDAGANSFMLKPFNEHNLFKSIGNQLELMYVNEEGDESLPTQITLSELKRELINNVPEKLITEMSKSVEIGNMNAFNELLKNIKEINSHIVNELLSLSKNCEYKIISGILSDVIIDKHYGGLTKSEPLGNKPSLQLKEKNTFRVLVVEDDEGSRTIITNIIKSEGYLVKSTEDGQDAIDIFTQWQPHLIIIDAKLHETNGFDVIRKIRLTHKGQNIPVIMTSGHVFEETHYFAPDIKISKFMLKPFNLDDLLKNVANLLKTE